MAIEIEHKYLVKDFSFKQMATDCVRIKQGYLCITPTHVVRVRIYGSQGFLTVKSKNEDDSRKEFEYEIPYSDACEMLTLCPSVIAKSRWKVQYESHVWEIDEFDGKLSGLILAEIELNDSDDKYSLPPFIGENVTNNPEYYNSSLSIR